MKAKVCEKCGAGFGCGSDGPEPCWCGEYSLSNDTLNHLRETYGDCLCERCLGKMAQAGNKAK